MRDRNNTRAFYRLLPSHVLEEVAAHVENDIAKRCQDETMNQDAAKVRSVERLNDDLRRLESVLAEQRACCSAIVVDGKQYTLH